VPYWNRDYSLDLESLKGSTACKDPELRGLAEEICHAERICRASLQSCLRMPLTSEDGFDCEISTETGIPIDSKLRVENRGEKGYVLMKLRPNSYY